MPAFKTNGTAISYMTSRGVRESRIVNMTKVHNTIYYRMENGDYVEDTPLGFAKAYDQEELLRDLGKLSRGTTVE